MYKYKIILIRVLYKIFFFLGGGGGECTCSCSYSIGVCKHTLSRGSGCMPPPIGKIFKFTTSETVLVARETTCIVWFISACCGESHL